MTTSGIVYDSMIQGIDVSLCQLLTACVIPCHTLGGPLATRKAGELGVLARKIYYKTFIFNILEQFESK